MSWKRIQNLIRGYKGSHGKKPHAIIVSKKDWFNLERNFPRGGREIKIMNPPKRVTTNIHNADNETIAVGYHAIFIDDVPVCASKHCLKPILCADHNELVKTFDEFEQQEKEL